VERNSAETQITVTLNLDGSGKSQIKTGIPFLDHMLNQIAKHGLFDLTLNAAGDLEIDPHHTMEDCALALGEAFRLAAGDRKGIQRMASAAIPMDESLAEIALDFSGRPYAVLHTQWTEKTLAEIPTSLFEHFVESFASAARINLFVRVLAGKDNHHMSEAIFKGLAKALDQALMIDPRRKDLIPSTKEILF
jgi:imidazoleglycerol-phosphate dehydratase